MIATKEQRIATIGTAVFCVLFLLMLVLVRFINDPTEEEEGVLVNFGDTEQGMGEVEPRPAMAQAIPTPPTPSESAPSEASPEPQQTGDEDVVNQDFEESAVIEQKKKKKREDDELKRRQEEVKRQQELEQQRLAEEQRRQEEERKRQEEIQRQQQQQLEAAQNKAKNAFAGRNPNGGNTGEGVTGQPGNQGSLNGDINSNNRVGNGGGNGINLNLAGRSFGSTPPKPEYNSKSEGRVVIEIRVDRQGNVVAASTYLKTSTTTDKVLHEAALKAAKMAKFNSDPQAPEIQIGYITYTFIQQ
jgi:TonB family protein